MKALAKIALACGFLIPRLSAAAQMTLGIDHATYCGSDLVQTEKKFQEIHLPAEYGGPHATVTHMAIIGFRDGSYLELIAPRQPAAAMPPDQRWRQLMLDDGGPCAWAVNVPDVAVEVERLTNLGFKVAGPLPGTRNKPDGSVLVWQTGFVQPGDPGSELPFFIHDKTDRAQRVTLSPALAKTELTGLAEIVIGAKDLDASVAKFQRAYNLPAPEMFLEEKFGARIAYFHGTPVMLATPLRSTGWLAERVGKYGDTPAAFLIGTTSLKESARRFGLSSRTRLAGRHLVWFSPGVLGGFRIGIIQN